MLISTCLAEASETLEEVAAVAETADTESTSLSLFMIVFIVIGLYYVVTGIITMIQRKPFGGLAQQYEKYTDESVRANSVGLGLINVLTGLLLIAIEVFLKRGLPLVKELIIVGVCVAVVIVVGVVVTRKLVKKEN